MKNLNLCEILKGHEGETFYSPCYGYITLKAINPYCYFSLFFNDNNSEYRFTKYGKISTSNDADCVLFPSKDQRDWNKWVEENKSKPKIPKTWSELEKLSICDSYILGKGIGEVDFTSVGNTPIEKSVLALLKIHQLIEIGYGGNITNEEWKEHTKIKYTIDLKDKKLICSYTYHFKSHIAFHTKEQAEEFLKYSENVQLLKDYFMI